MYFDGFFGSYFFFGEASIVMVAGAFLLGILEGLLERPVF
jgi:hypothetical protein